VVVTAFGWERDAFCEWMPGERVLWLGHPLADDLAGSARSTTSSSHLALLPGSRRSEVRTLAPIMVGACQALARSGAAHNAVFAVHDRAAERWVRESVGTPIKIAVGCTGEVLDGASAAVACAGTVTLEAACAGVPTTIVYRTDRLTHSIAKRLVRVDFCGLPNIVLGEAVYPELVQSDLTSAALAETIRRTMSMPDSHWSEQAMRVRNRIANTDLADDGLTVAERVAAAVFTAAAERVPPCAA